MPGKIRGRKMSTLDVQKLKDDAVEWALTHGVAFKESSYSAVHTPFTLTPTEVVY